ncbi:glycerol dehydrogenase (plasmid) [Cupriavidus sp. KK10]|jgi:glycerol dehydrogenase|uniref:glycerol dehydrogenase n=1 Tax=Cupriavidus sp. KK10 TaxID=1478019 RepID=UPI001BA8FFD4|nr:glycerol dehydrogenase [Cupriavidus sp. KK10]QUN32745.1 glycerol dehydrogenase [Cupriavidus sp. KK10]
MLRMMGFPGQYVQGPGALPELGALLAKSGWQRPLVLCDAIVTDKIWPVVSDSLQSAGLAVRHALFPGECTRAAIDALADRARGDGHDVVVGLGGGKALDTAKGVSLALDVPVVVCPTIASNDAPTSRVIVLYDKAHRLAGAEFLKSNPAAVIVDTQIIAQAPARFFAAGIGDAVSKKFEAQQCKATGRNNVFGTPPLDTALLLATATYDTLVKHGPAAYRAVIARQADEAVERVVEATVLLSGVGFEGGGLSLAHGLTRGFSAIPALANALHGEQVAFGALVQLVAEGRPQAEIDELLDLLCTVGLPVTLTELGLPPTQATAAVAQIADLTLSGQVSQILSPPLTAARLETAIRLADRKGAIALNRRKP